MFLQQKHCIGRCILRLPSKDHAFRLLIFPRGVYILIGKRGDRATLQKICTDGLSDSFIARVASRSPGEHFRWNLSKYLGFPRVVADRSVILPVKDSALRQVAVRIRSKQSLAKIIPATKGQPETVVEGTDKEKNVDEYVVIQRRIIKGKEDQWMVWGTTQETRVDEVLGTQETKAANKEAEAV